MFKKFENFEFQMKSLDSQIKKSGTDYNPSKYVRGFKLLQGVNVSELPDVQNTKKTDKYSYEEYLKSKNSNQNASNTGVTGNSISSNYNQQNQRNELSPNKYSYEQYKMKKQLNKSADNLFSQDDYKKPSSSFNKTNLDNNTLPSNNFLNNKQNNPHNFLNFDLSKPVISQTTILTPIEDTQKGEQIKDSTIFNPYSALTFDMTPQQPKTNYGGSYLPGNNFNMNRGSMNYNQQSHMNYSNIPNSNFNMPNYNNGYSQNNNNINNSNLNPGNANFNYNNPGNMKFPK